MRTSKINSAGKWLREDAAASYFRMLAAGMSEGGIASAGRTRAEQEHLYWLWQHHQGNLAARPGTSAHETGRALDVTRGTGAHTWMSQGGIRLQTKLSEHIRANDFGWYRTVPSEAWHFAYNPSKDKARLLKRGDHNGAVVLLQKALLNTVYGDLIRVSGGADGYFGEATERAILTIQKERKLVEDGKCGTITWAAVAMSQQPSTDPGPTPPPKPQEPIMKSRTFWAGHANMEAERFHGLVDASPRRGEYLKEKLPCSVYTFCENPRKQRDAIKRVLSKGWKSFAVNYVSVFWGDSWKFIGKKVLTFNDNGIHGAVRVTLRDVASGLEMDVISVHVRPNAAFPKSWSDEKKRNEGKLKDVAKALTLVRDNVTTIISGDWNTAYARKLVLAHKAAFSQVTPNVDTSDTPGEQKLDAMFVCGNIVVHETETVNTNISDHKHFRIRATLAESGV